MRTKTKKATNAIAVIGMAGRFPGAKNLGEFWKNLHDGIESITSFSREELLAAGVDPRDADNPAYVRAGTYLEHAEDFDAPFWGVSPREAEVMDPQHRVFLECAWEALEDAAYDAETYPGLIGAFGGSSMNTYGTNNLLGNREILAAVGAYQAMIGNDKDFLTTRVSYKLNLRGPSVAVQTACSTSLVAVQLACQSLLSHQCDIALSGGVSINFPQKTGYLYQENMILSPDGKCRPFDANGKGIRPGEGVGVVVLKRLEDALRDGDNVHAVILGSAINNDGSLKIGYTAPSVDGQAEVIATAQAIADVDPETITYVEAHGTATPLGDPIEIVALTKAFQASTKKKQFCGIGSLKSNLGHLDAAAGVAGLIKTILALKNHQLPPSLNFQSPNTQINFQDSPFYVNTQLSEWQPDGFPRRAGVSSFGIGGTNAHVVLEEAPTLISSSGNRPNEAVILSAKTAAALETATRNLAQWLRANPIANLADVAYTLQIGRRQFEHRRTMVCKDIEDAAKTLESGDRRRIYTAHTVSPRKKVAFMFSGQGSQYVNMAAGVYRTEQVFRDCLDQCAESLRPRLGLDLRAVVYPAAKEGAIEETTLLNQTWLTQPALFAVEYALAKLWMSWGIEPHNMIGHSIGEYVAACLAGVFSVEDALNLVAIRGRLMQDLPPGAMLIVPMPERDIREHLKGAVSLAAINAPSLCVATGPVNAIDALEKELEQKGAICQRLRTSHAFHSEMMEPALKPFVEQVASVSRNQPRIPFLSNVTGTWISSSQATDPAYWGKHLREAVRFSEGVAELAKDQGQVLLEIGPGHTLKTLARQNFPGISEDYILSSLPHPHETQPDEAFIQNTLCRLWLAGVPVPWARLHADSKRRRISLPAYPFERQRFYVEPQREESAAPRMPADLAKREDVADWFWVYSWKRSVPLSAMQPKFDPTNPATWLVFLDTCGVGISLVEQLKKQGLEPVTVQAGATFVRSSGNAYEIAPGNRPDYDRLIEDMRASGKYPDYIVHLWSVSPNNRIDGPTALRGIGTTEDMSFYSLLYLAQALANADQEIVRKSDLLIVSNGMQTVVGKDGWCPEKAILLGPCKVIPREHELLSTRSLDIELKGDSTKDISDLAIALLGEIAGGVTDNIVAFRGGYRWLQNVEPIRLAPADRPQGYLRPKGTYLITGGLGGVGLTFAEHFARTAQARLILTSRSGLPPKSEWKSWVESHDSADSVSVKIGKVQQLEDLGADVMVASADSADEEQMQRVVAEATRRFGPIHGVIHAAGTFGVGPIQFKTRESIEIVLRPKLQGTLILERLLNDANLDFFVLCSSVNALYGYIGAVDYCAANAYQDAFALSRASNGVRPVTSIDWDSWQKVGMAANAVVPEELKKSRQKFLERAITPEEGVRALDYILANSLAQVLVVTQDLASLAEQMNIFVSPRAGTEDRREKESGIDSDVVKQSGLHNRPELTSAYVSPRNEKEQALIGIWTELLGVHSIGVDDNFFDLGGHSLLATRVLSRVQELFKVRLPLRTIFEAPTVAQLAERLQTVVWTTQPVDASGGGESREEIEF